MEPASAPIHHPRPLFAIIEEARRRSLRRRAAILALLLLVVAVAAGAALFLNGGGGESLTADSRSSDSVRDCYGLAGISGSGRGGARVVLASNGCDLVRAAELASAVTSKADWYAAHSPKVSVDGLAMGCDLPRDEARSFSRRLGPTFSVKTLRSFRAACGG